MNIDNTPMNPGMKRTKYHVPTPQEIRHDLKEATVFSEMDMGWGFHQLELDETSKNNAIFQTHEGLHRMERLYFGPSAASGIFHQEVRKALLGLRGVLNIHDNLIVWGTDHEDHFNNLKNCLECCKENGIILKLSKSSFGMNEIDWFGRQFTTHGVSADPKKLQMIMEAGKPKTTEDVRSLLMACQYNAKFLFDHPETSQSYEEITKPLRHLLKKDMKFFWGHAQNDAYLTLMSILTDPATLRPYDPAKKTHFVADSCEDGLQASIYQEKEPNNWVPIDHLSRAMSIPEQNYSPIERESLAQSWGMEQFRYYLIGTDFTCWTDHEPLPPIYNNRQRPTSKRLAKHRDNIQDLSFTMKYLPGKDMPCDFGSRHPPPINHLTDSQKEKAGIDVGNIIYVRKLIFTNSPDAVTSEHLKAAAINDPDYQTTLGLISKGKRLPTGNIYSHVQKEMTVADNLLLKGDKIIVPKGEHFPGSGNIQKWILDAAHDGHPGITAMKNLLRSQIWFPGMDTKIEELLNECHDCQSSTKVYHRDPHTPTTAPQKVWEKLDVDH